MNDKNTQQNAAEKTAAGTRDSSQAHDDSSHAEGPSSPRLNQSDVGGAHIPSGPSPTSAPSLTGYYSARRGQPRALVKALRLGPGTGFPDTERQTILAEISRLDPYLAKSVTLAQAATDMAKDRAVFDWIGELVVHELRGHWAPEAGLSAAETFDEISRSIRAQMQRKDARKKCFNLLLTALVWLAPRGLQPEDALRAIEHALTVAKRSSVTSDERQRQAMAELVKIKASPKLLKALLQILAPWRMRTREAEAQAAAHREEVAALNSRIQALEGRVAEFRELTTNLEARLADHGRLLEDRERRLSTQHNLAQSQLALTRGTINGWLENEVRPRLADALDAVECEPPRHEVLRERLKAVLALLDQKKGGHWG